MKKIISLFVVLAFAGVSAAAQDDYVPTKENLAARENFEDMRFGIFLHWGIYSMFAQGEWYLNYGPDAQEYAKAAGGFYPAAFDAREWVKAIKASGAKYICFTTRHHDGFSLFDTAVSDYDVMDATPFKRDIVAELADACHEEGIALHFYYSLLDWTREDYPVGRTGLTTGRKGDAQDYESYRKFMKDQLTELLTKYGDIGAIWFDGLWDHDSDPTPFDWKLPDIYSHIHSVSPACLIGNNHHLTPFPGEDFQMFERDLPGENTTGWAADQTVSALPLEMCQTMNGMWGYKIQDQKYKSVENLVRLIVRAASKGSNLLLNIGPQPDGKLPATALDRLRGIGEWMTVYGESVFGTGATGIPEQSWGVTTRNGDCLYLHLIEPLEGVESIYLPLDSTGKSKVKSVKAMKDGTPLKYKVTDGRLVITLSEVPSDIDYVIKVEL
ncbi:MAG: alpha-L-fucosidase [Bacteroidales bacterium]|nr:alpha-L-fucosidase [Bacteroidales bacterium]